MQKDAEFIMEGTEFFYSVPNMGLKTDVSVCPTDWQEVLLNNPVLSPPVSDSK